MDVKLAKRILEAALARLVENDLPADRGFPSDIGERPLMFRIAHYMIACGAEDDGISVDCDYNKHIDDVKRMLPPKEEILTVEGRKVQPPRFFPDIVLHVRRSDKSNLLVCEIKRSTDARLREIDHDRLIKLTTPGWGYEYDLGAFIEIFQAERRIALTYFKKGKPIATLMIPA